jgi:hypothetical protein
MRVTAAADRLCREGRRGLRFRAAFYLFPDIRERLGDREFSTTTESATALFDEHVWR